jgi:hypothetical protein
VVLAAARANGAEREAIPDACETCQRFGRPADAKETAIVCLSAALVSPHGDAQNCPSAIIGYGGISFGR